MSTHTRKLLYFEPSRRADVIKPGVNSGYHYFDSLIDRSYWIQVCSYMPSYSRLITKGDGLSLNI